MKIVGDNLIIKFEGGELDHHSSEEIRRRIDNEYYNNNLKKSSIRFRWIKLYGQLWHRPNNGTL